MTRIRPNPEVYRLAAEIIEVGKENYSCVAIEDAVNKIYSKRSIDRRHEIIWTYRNQYASMFGATNTAILAMEDMGCYSGMEMLIEHPENTTRDDHPYWNRDRYDSTEETKQLRVLALLMMATIVESGG